MVKILGGDYDSPKHISFVITNLPKDLAHCIYKSWFYDFSQYLVAVQQTVPLQRYNVTYAGCNTCTNLTWCVIGPVPATNKLLDDAASDSAISSMEDSSHTQVNLTSVH